MALAYVDMSSVIEVQVIFGVEKWRFSRGSFLAGNLKNTHERF
jgi:hypothetical protein